MGSLLTILVGLAVVSQSAIIWRAKPARPTWHAPPFRRSPVAGRGSTRRSSVTEKNTAGCRPTHSLACGRHVDGKRARPRGLNGLYRVHPASLDAPRRTKGDGHL